MMHYGRKDTEEGSSERHLGSRTKAQGDYGRACQAKVDRIALTKRIEYLNSDEGCPFKE